MLKKFDIFGISPKLYINNQSKQQSYFGTFLSFMLLICVIIACWVYGKDMYYKQNPKTTYTELFSAHPERFDFKPETFNFGFGLEDSGYNIYSDPRAFKVKYTQEIIKRVQLADGSVQFVTESKDLKARNCRKEDFIIDQEYFHNIQNLDQLYCIDDLSQTYIEGDYGAEEYTRILGKVQKCVNSPDSDVQCYSDGEIEATLKGNYYAIFFTDQIFNPKDFEKPFSFVGRDQFGSLSKNIYKEMEWYFKNVYVEDNTGIIFDTQNLQRGLQFSQEKIFVQEESEKQNDIDILTFGLRFQKVKYTKVYRKYLNLAEVLAQVGGILKAMMVFFLVLSYLIGTQEYNLNFANSVFKFDYQKNSNNKGDKKSQEKQKSQTLYFSSIFSIFKPKKCQNDKIQEQKELLNFAMQKISNHLNVTELLNKIMEFEKLKILLLNDQQRKLFEYIPKPTISRELIQQQIELQNENNQNIDKSSQVYQINQKPGSSSTMKKRQSIQQKAMQNVILKDNRDSEQKISELYFSYQIIKSKTQKSDVDYKILNFIDEELKKKFKTMDQSQKDQIVRKSKTYVQQNFQNVAKFPNSETQITQDEVNKSLQKIIQKQQSNLNNLQEQNESNSIISGSGQQSRRKLKKINIESVHDDTPSFQYHKNNYNDNEELQVKLNQDDSNDLNILKQPSSTLINTKKLQNLKKIQNNQKQYSEIENVNTTEHQINQSTCKIQTNQKNQENLAFSSQQYTPVIPNQKSEFVSLSNSKGSGVILEYDLASNDSDIIIPPESYRNQEKNKLQDNQEN